MATPGLFVVTIPVLRSSTARNNCSADASDEQVRNSRNGCVSLIRHMHPVRLPFATTFTPVIPHRWSPNPATVSYDTYVQTFLLALLGSGRWRSDGEEVGCRQCRQVPSHHGPWL